eukprot:249120-Chlamydomonas_euryale.AAC.1
MAAGPKKWESVGFIRDFALRRRARSVRREPGAERCSALAFARARAKHEGSRRAKRTRWAWRRRDKEKSGIHTRRRRRADAATLAR